MGSFGGLGIGLSFLFGCALMGLAAELCYLLWCKKRALNNVGGIEKKSPFSSSCWKNPSYPQAEGAAAAGDLEMGSSKGFCGDHHHEQGGVEAELMRIHNLCGPPRFLFTIREESGEESENGRSRRSSRRGSRSLGGGGDVVFAVDSCGGSHGFDNPLFESNGLRSSPPPKFKFLKDAEEKLMKRLMMEEAERRKRSSKVDDDDDDDEDPTNLVGDCNNVQEQKVKIER